MKITHLLLALAASAVLATGCARQRDPANDALSRLETSLQELRDDAAKYAPEGLKGIESQLANLKQSFENKDYANVLAGTPELQKAVSSLKAAVESGKEQARAALAAAKAEWEGLNQTVPQQLAAIQARIEELSKSKRLPWGIKKEEFEGSKAAFEAMQTQWKDAAVEYENGDPAAANAKAKTAQGMGEQIIDTLKVERT